MRFARAKVTMSIKDRIQEIVDAGYTRAQAKQTLKAIEHDEIWMDLTETYQVAIRRNADNGFGLKMIHLSIKRVDREPIHDWRVLQEIKNALVGPEHEAIELYPAESRRVDSANQYHLWVFADSAVRVPLGFTERLVTETTLGKSKQRPFTED